MIKAFGNYSCFTRNSCDAEYFSAGNHTVFLCVPHIGYLMMLTKFARNVKQYMFAVE